jgi:tetratricopeptide (TPR) repeat protein
MHEPFEASAPDSPPGRPSLPVPGATGSAELAAKLDTLRAQLSRREFAAAHEAARALCTQYPGDRDALYVLAVSLRCLERIPEALEVVQELEQRHPSFARAFEERGYCHIARREAAPAITAFTKCVMLNPWLPGPLEALQRLYRMLGRAEEADAAAELLANIGRYPREIRIARSLLADGDVGAAERLVRGYLPDHGDDLESTRLLAHIAMMQDVPYEAEVLLEDVLRIAPEHHAARYEYAVALIRQLKHVRAREELEKLLSTDPGNRLWRLAHADACGRLGEPARALTVYQELLRETPEDLELHLNAGFALKTLGRTTEAIASWRAAAALSPASGRAYWNLANLKTYRFEDIELERMMRYEADGGTSFVERYHLDFALGKALEDRCDYERSFGYYERGNALKKRESRYRPEFFEEQVRLQANTCTAEFFAARRGWGCPDAAPIFIVGMPRAGSTLIEQILASHSQVEGTMELANILHLVGDLQCRPRPGAAAGYPGVLATLTREECARFGEAYIRDTLVYRHGRPFFIDKWPGNFRDLGLIHLILPNARIIDARREPMACCFSNFKQLFTVGGPQFIYSFEDIARHYCAYVRLMRHWEAVLPGKILRVRHEDLVTDFPLNVARIFRFCGLEPEPACFEFHRTERAVHSSSSEQVRQPISRAGLGQWRHFERWLQPLREALERSSEP